MKEKSMDDEVRKVLNNIPYEFYVNKNESKFQQDEDKRNEKVIDNALSRLNEIYKAGIDKEELKRKISDLESQVEEFERA